MCGIYKLYPHDIPYASHSPQITPEGTIPPFPIDILKKKIPMSKRKTMIFIWQPLFPNTIWLFNIAMENHLFLIGKPR